MSPNRKEELLLALPAVCQYITDAIHGGGIVLVHSEAESKACTAVCAYLMTAQGLSAQAARDKIEKDMPLFNATSTFRRNLDLFEACGHKPHLEHPAVQQWLYGGTATPPNMLVDMNPNLTAAALLGAFNHAQRARNESAMLAVASASQGSGNSRVPENVPPAADTRRRKRPERSCSPKRPTVISVADEAKLRATAARLLGDTSLDMPTFGQALGALTLNAGARAKTNEGLPEPHAVVVDSS
ncbi:uncharacterized protein SCHCODRAFT_02500488 [Schizophyllum commune H4-8]|uniref:uncharacterized protein n=1 Tax=Schizophyllum commune (strain H4-8 / FGSC 9210) TaxID=578458 RepID=UPI00215FF969|nr:uncharacterized protein SCHCODRAFT_02500488 [Schizophyllum commune H4-8]KAI5893840.1 hypothetical protein SCHCODRAFT_02500488 [Schizophyllum commune H4-8]